VKFSRQDSEFIERTWLDAGLCWLGRCRYCGPASDDTGCWGECMICHKRHGFVSSADLRSYLDRELPSTTQREPE
jgi:hypothetical protein